MKKELIIIMIGMILLIVIPVMGQEEFEIDENGVLVKYSGPTRSCFDTNTREISVVVPEGVTAIGDYVFTSQFDDNRCLDLSDITLPTTLKSIGEGAFYRQSSLKEIKIPDNVKTIEKEAFWDCSNLNVILSSGSKLSAIGEEAFFGCKITEITLPKSLKSIGDYAFSGNYLLSEITIPDSVQSIGDGVFQGCKSLESIKLPSGMKSIPINFFSGCTKLKNVSIPSGVTKIGYSAFRDCESLSNISIPSGVIDIGSAAFMGCRRLTSVVIPSGVTELQGGTFEYCENLMNITLPAGLKKIDGYDFFGTALMSVILPDGLTEIGSKTFDNTEYLNVITMPASVRKVGDYALGNYDWYSKRYQRWFAPSEIQWIWENGSEGSDTLYAYDPAEKQKTTAIWIENEDKTVVSGKTITVSPNNEYKLDYYLSPESALSLALWTSDNLSVAWVDVNGKVTFTGFGTVKITASTIDGSNKTAWVKLKRLPLAKSISIHDAKGNNISEKEISISSDTYQLKTKILPSDAFQRVKWIRNNTIASVSADGKVTFSKPGTITITVRTEDSSEKETWVKITYAPIPLATAVKIQDSNGTDITGKTVTVTSASYQLKSAATPSGAAQKFTWTSGSTDVATVDANGKVTFKKAGSVKITATASDGSKKAASVTLKYTPLATAVKMQNSSGTDITGKTMTVKSASYQLKAVATPTGVAQKFTWASSNTGIATVDANGKVTFKKAGSVKITATVSDSSKKFASVTLKFQPQKPTLGIKDTNIRGKNKEVQVVVPWSADLIRVECTLYDDSTGKEVKPTYRERIDSTGKNKVVSYVGDPLVNGNVYRFKLRVYNGQWSNYVEKYAMPISNVFGATVVAGNKAMMINTQHREPATGTRYMVFDAATQKELAYKAGTKTDTTWKHEGLQNGKLYYVVAVPYRDYKGQRLWGPNENRIYFIPMAIPTSGKVSFSGSNATVSIAADSTVDGIRVLYRTVGGALKNGCEAKGAKCTIKGLNSGTAYEFYAMKYKVSEGKTYYSTGTLIPYKTTASGLTAPQMNPVVAMSNSGYTTFTIRKSSNAEGISVLYKIGSGNFVQACEAAGNSCSTTLDISKNYTFFIMQYKTVNGKKVYSPGIVARDFTSMKNGEFERMYTGFTLADESIDMNEIYDVLDGYMGEDALLMAEALAVMGEDMVSKGAEEFEPDTFYEDDGFDYSGYDSEDPYGEYEAEGFDSYDSDDAVYEPYDESVDGIDMENEPETGIEEPLDEGDGSEENEGFSMYYFGDSEKPLPPAPSFNNL